MILPWVSIISSPVNPLLRQFHYFLISPAVRTKVRVWGWILAFPESDKGSL